MALSENEVGRTGFLPRSAGHGGLTPFEYSEISITPAPFGYTFNLLSVIRPTTPLEINIPSPSDISVIGGATWFCYWDGQQDLTFIPNDANTLLNGVSAPIVFTASLERTLISIVNYKTGYEIHQIGGGAVSPDPSFVGYSARGTHLWDGTGFTLLDLEAPSLVVYSSNFSSDWEWNSADNRQNYKYVGLTTKTFNLTATITAENAAFTGIEGQMQHSTAGVIAKGNANGDLIMTVTTVHTMATDETIQFNVVKSPGGDENSITHVNLGFSCIC